MAGLKFLLLEDSSLDAELIEAILSEGDITCSLVQVKTGEEYQSTLQQSGFDLILSDYSIPGFDGIRALEMAQEMYPNVPFLFVTATMGEEVAIETLKKGATDYVLKQRLERLVPSVKRALREAQERRARQHAEAELNRREQEFRALVENSPDVIGRFDTELKILYVNPVIEKLTGKPPDTLIGKDCLELGVPEEFYAPWKQVLLNVLDTGVGSDFETQFPSLDGSDRYFQSRIVPEFAQDGSIESLLCIAHDITDVKQAEVLLRQQKEELEKLNRIKDEFLAVLSHELRSPLNAILGWAKILRTRKVDEVSFERALEIIERNAQMQTQLIEDLLDISRIIRGKFTLEPEPTNLVIPIEAAIETMRLAAKAKSIDLKFSILDSATDSISNNNSNHNSNHNSRFQVLGDANRLQQIVWNLLSNAIKFTPSDGEVEIALESVKINETDDKDNIAQIKVKDTGVGIDKDFIPYVFESFRQEDASTTRKYGGLGLGLAIVRNLTELHGGSVTVDSLGQNQGATFTVRIPLLENRQEGIGNMQNSQLSNAEFPLNGVKILIVDDDADSRDFLDFALSDLGAIITSVESVALALEIFSSLKPDILISDIGMPEQDGYDFIHQIRKLPPEEGGQIPAIALTAYASDKDRDEAVEAGFQIHLSKPVMPDELTTVITQLLNR
ncbi:MAG: response regulator [Scytonematopsis contorta HA4267-MV1]|jgi:PAS domain S-box-containing protein|nr:response regulator [Scytonematopsis contorta HA4267-MV1]